MSDTNKGGKPVTLREQLEKFEYKGVLDGVNFKAYLELVEGQKDEETGHVVVAGLDQTKQYVFQVFKVTSIRKKEYPKLQDSPVYIAGIRFIQDAPVRETKGTLKDALLMNAQIEQPEYAKNHMLYYLLKKS